MGGQSVSDSPRTFAAPGWLLAAPLLAALIGACSMVGPGGPTPTANPSASPSHTPPPPTSAGESLLAPPIATLQSAGGVVHAGVLGSWSYRDAFADAPWQSAEGLARIELAAAAALLTVAMPPPATFSRWSARYAAAADPTGDVVRPLGSGGADDDSDRLAAATFEGPPSGEWVIEVQLTFADGDGSAAYYWYVAVP